LRVFTASPLPPPRRLGLTTTTSYVRFPGPVAPRSPGPFAGPPRDMIRTCRRHHPAKYGSLDSAQISFPPPLPRLPPPGPPPRLISHSVCMMRNLTVAFEPRVDKEPLHAGDVAVFSSRALVCSSAPPVGAGCSLTSNVADCMISVDTIAVDATRVPAAPLTTALSVVVHAIFRTPPRCRLSLASRPRSRIGLRFFGDLYHVRPSVLP